MLAIQIFDQKKFKKKDQGFLGVINLRIGSAIDLDTGSDGESIRKALYTVVTDGYRNAHSRFEEIK